MKSRITIEVDFDNGQPYIKVINEKTDDVRDKLVSFFRERFGYTSSWAKIVYPFFSDSGPTQFQIRPITPSELEIEGKAMLEQARLLKENSNNPETVK